MAAMRSVARRYRHFPLFATPSSLLNTVVGRLPILLLPFYFDLELVGLYGRAFTALAIPLSLVGTAVARVFFVHAAEANRAGGLASLTAKVHARLVMTGLYPTLLLIAAGPGLFGFVFGTEWRLAGIYEQYLACWFFLSAVASPLTRLFDVLEKQRTELVVSILTSILLTGALVLGGSTGNAAFTMALVAVVGSATRLVQIGILLKLAGIPPRQIHRPYLRYALMGLPLALIVRLVHGSGPLWGIALTSVATSMAYLGIVAWNERRAANGAASRPQ